MTLTATAPAAAEPSSAASDLGTLVAHKLLLDSIRPSPFNRKRFDEKALEELADSINVHGVQQAIVVRPVKANKPGGATFELVAGERRWRACKLLAARGAHLPPHWIPGFVRELDEFAAREIALIENTHRNDLHPLEEAQAYEDLLLKPVGGGEFDPPRKKGYTVEQLADKIGKKPNFVFGRLKLLELIPAAREAFLADELKLKIAEAVARISPASEQKRAVEDLIRGWGGEPFSHRQAMQHLHTNYMLKLSKAPFPIADEKLLPKAGACTTCPKRSGNNPGLFGDSTPDDMCLDSACHKAKEKAHGARQVEQAREAGKTVLLGKAAEKVLGDGHSVTADYYLQQTGHINLDKPAPELTGGSRKTLRSLLGDDFDKGVLVKAESDKQPTNVAKVTDVKAALKSKGLLAPATKEGKKVTAEDIKKQREERLDQLMGSRVHSALLKHFEADKSAGFPDQSAGWMRWLAFKLLNDYDVAVDVDALRAAATGSKADGLEWLQKLDAEKLCRVLMCIVIGEQLRFEDSYSPRGMSNEPKVANSLAKDIGFDLVAFRKEIADEVDAAIRDEIQALADVVAPAAKKTTAAKKVAKGASTPSTSAAAQGNQSPATKGKKVPLTPEKALADAVAKDAGLDDDTCLERTEKHIAKTTSPKTDQKDEPAQPPANNQAPPRVGERWKVRADVKGRAKTAGREGTVDNVADDRVTLRWGPKKHELGVYAIADLEFVGISAEAAAAKKHASMAWPFPTTPAAGAK